MRPFYGLALLLLVSSAGELRAQAGPRDRALPPTALWGAAPLPREFAVQSLAVGRQPFADTTRRRPFFLPRPGEHTAYWVGFGAGLAVSPLLWCEGTGCTAWLKASTSLLLGIGGAVSGLLLSRTF
jgi:hypothetical protein